MVSIYRTMRSLIILIGTLICISSFSQQKLEYNEIRNELLSSKDTSEIIISFYSPMLEKKERPYIIEIVKENTLIDIPIQNKDGDQLSFDILSNQTERTKFIEYFESTGLLNNLYFRSNLEYFNINDLEDKFLAEDPILIIELFVGLYKIGLLQLYIPVYSTEKAIEIISDTSKIFDDKFRQPFKILIKEIKRNAAQQPV